MKNRYLLRSTKKRQNKISVALVAIVVILLIIVVSVGKYNINQKRDFYEKKEAQLREQISEEEARSVEIDEYEKYTKTKKYAEEIAKEQLGLVKDDEIIFKEE